ncbi:MAG: hypothetical protein V7606_3356 [Burkholderiales bacterium]
MAFDSLRERSTIAAFRSPYRIQDLGIIGSEAANCSTNGESTDLQEFKIRMANMQGTREAASLLLKKMYSWRGYSIEPTGGQQPDKLTLTADTGGNTIGTMSLYFDSRDGLPADENFRDELDELRAQNRRLCEPSRLAIDWYTPKRVFAALIHISHIYSHKILGNTDWIIEVNPRHAAFYKRMLGFRELAGERMCTRANAPAVLLRLDCQYMASQIQKLGGLFEDKGRENSYYPYFFPVEDEPGITSRLMNNDTAHSESMPTRLRA